MPLDSSQSGDVLLFWTKTIVPFPTSNRRENLPFVVMCDVSNDNFFKSTTNMMKKEMTSSSSICEDLVLKDFTDVLFHVTFLFFYGFKSTPHPWAGGPFSLVLRDLSGPEWLWPHKENVSVPGDPYARVCIGICFPRSRSHR